MRKFLSIALLLLAVSSLLSMVGISAGGFLPGETIGQWVWYDKMSMPAIVFILSALVCSKGEKLSGLAPIVSWSLVAFATIEAVRGLCQLYGCVSSNHSLYTLTGSFFNPGPYSGYLAMAFPLCMHQWWVGDKWRQIVAGGAMLLVLCVLPAGMSRSAWVAAAISGLWVYGWHAKWGMYLENMWLLHKRRMLIAIAGGLCIFILAGYLLFALKPDSARGRLFMWKMTCHAIAERPLTGHGIGCFTAAYGNAQEAYFAAGDYESWEERVAGSPEYAFNEYLQVAVELGIPLALCLLVLVVLCLYRGVCKGRYGICGAILSLMIFSFSSYPLQLPVFIVTLGGLLLACIFDGNRWQWLGVAVLVGIIGGFRLKNDLQVEQACREWMNARVLYSAGAYQSAEKEYGRLYPLLRKRASFLFEYGHGLHKQQQFSKSNRILKEALQLSCDPMILNVIGKNYQQMGDCLSAEDWFIRSTHRLPGRIYPYYLLAKLYAEPSFRQPDKFEKMKRMVLTKEPKVQSTAIRQMREEVKKIQIVTPFK